VVYGDSHVATRRWQRGPLPAVFQEVDCAVIMNFVLAYTVLCCDLRDGLIGGASRLLFVLEEHGSSAIRSSSNELCY
jgi:hypothetical protein